MTFKELEELIKKEFVGKNYSSYTISWEVSGFVRKTLGIEKGLTTRSDKQYVCVSYKGRFLLSFDIKKKLIKKHCSYCNDWEISNIVFYEPNNHKSEDTIKSVLEEIEATIEKENQSKQQEARKLIEDMKVIKEAFNFKSYDEVYKLCQKIYDKRYSNEVNELLKEVE